MNTNEDHRKERIEKHRLAFLLMGILNATEKCVSALRNGFVDQVDFNETKKTINRLRKELHEIDTDLVNKLDKG